MRLSSHVRGITISSVALLTASCGSSCDDEFLNKQEWSLIQQAEFDNANRAISRDIPTVSFSGGSSVYSVFGLTAHDRRWVWILANARGCPRIKSSAMEGVRRISREEYLGLIRKVSLNSDVETLLKSLIIE